MAKYPEGNPKLTRDRLVAKYSPKTAPLLLKPKKNVANSHFESVDMHSDEWMTELESLRNGIDKISVSAKIGGEPTENHTRNKFGRQETLSCPRVTKNVSPRVCMAVTRILAVTWVSNSWRALHG